MTATVLACKATIKAQDILTEHNAQVESIHTTKQQIESGEIQLSEGETYTENDYKSDITTTYVKTGLKLARCMHLRSPWVRYLWAACSVPTISCPSAMRA